MQQHVFHVIPNLSHRIIYSRSTIVPLLLDKDADIWKEGLYGTALGAAAFVGHKTVIEQLLDHGMDENLVDGHGRNALPLAQAFCSAQMKASISSFMPDMQAHSA